MIKKPVICLIIATIAILGTSALSLSQFVPNAPFKAELMAAPDFTLKDLKGKTFTLSKIPANLFCFFSVPPGALPAAPKYRQ